MKRLPRMIFDFIEGAAGHEVGASRNRARFDDIFLQPRAMVDVGERSLATKVLDRPYGLPFGFAPMGMCNLTHPKADRLLADTAKDLNIPMCLSSAGSSKLEDVRQWAGDLAWFQLYFGQSSDATFNAVDRARQAGYDTLILTVDVPQVARRIRDKRNGFTFPFQMTPSAFLDFATHPRWALSALATGVPSPQNLSSDTNNFDRNANRSGANWEFLKRLRDHWEGRLIVKGITSPEDALRVRSLGVDAIYVSNHGARQLDSVPAAIDLLPLIRNAVGPDFPLLFDSGLRNGEDIAKALALGADFVMLGRPALYALGADGGRGLQAVTQAIIEDLSLSMAQLGVTRIEDINENVLFEQKVHRSREDTISRPVPVPVAT